VIEGFLAAHDTFARDAIAPRYAAFLTAAGDVLVPPGIDGRDGFFVARLSRNSPS
jgi:hypothetical protein